MISFSVFLFYVYSIHYFGKSFCDLITLPGKFIGNTRIHADTGIILFLNCHFPYGSDSTRFQTTGRFEEADGRVQRKK